MISRVFGVPVVLAAAATGAAGGAAKPAATASAGPAAAMRGPAVPVPAAGMKRFIIVRHWPAGVVEKVDAEAKKHINTTNAAQRVTWVHSFASPDKRTTVCIYDGPNEQAIRDAAKANGMPADEIIEVPTVVLPR